jgi:hypothetical protein
MAADPMLTLLATDSKGEALLDKVLVNFQKRHWWHREAVTADKTTDIDTEWLDCTVSAPITITLATAANFPGQPIVIWAKGINTNGLVTITPSSGDTIQLAGSNGDVLLNVEEEWVMLCSDGISRWDMIIDNRT